MVPDPKKGSKTVCPDLVKARTSVRIRLRGFTVSWYTPSDVSGRSDRDGLAQYKLDDVTVAPG